MRRPAAIAAILGVLVVGAAAPAAAEVEVKSYPVPEGAHPHDVAPDPAGGPVWYTAQLQGALGRLDPKTGETGQIKLGEGSRPHGVIVGPKGLVWVTDGGLNAIVSWDPKTEKIRRYPLPGDRGNANLNTAAFDRNGRLWFTGQEGVYGRLDPASGEMQVWDAPRGYGPYGIDATPKGDIWYVSLAGSYLGKVDIDTGKVAVVDPPTKDAGTRRVWSDSKGVLWISEWHGGKLARHAPVVDGGVAGMEAAGGGPGRLLGLCRREGQGLGQRLRRQRRAALRPGDRDVPVLPDPARRRLGAPDAGPAGRGLGRRIGHRPVDRLPLRVRRGAPR